MGVGGWLMLLAIVQVLGLIKSLGALVASLQNYNLLGAIPGGRGAFFGEVGLALAFMALQVGVIFLLITKSRLFPKFFGYQWLAYPAVFVLTCVIISEALNVGLVEMIVLQNLGWNAVVFLAGGLWVAYLKNSARVRNTFVR